MHLLEPNTLRLKEIDIYQQNFTLIMKMYSAENQWINVVMPLYFKKLLNNTILYTFFYKNFDYYNKKRIGCTHKGESYIYKNRVFENYMILKPQD